MGSENMLSGILFLAIILFLSLTLFHTDNHQAKGSEVYVANEGEGKLTILDSEEMKAIDTVNLGESEPHNVNYDPKGRFIYVTNHGGMDPEWGAAGALRVIDKQNRTLIHSVEFGNEIGHVVPSRDGSKVYVSLKGVSTISEYAVPEFTLNRDYFVNETYTEEQLIHYLVESNSGEFLLSPNPLDSRISYIDLETGNISRSEIDNCSSSIAMSITSNDSYAFLSCSKSFKLHKIELPNLQTVDTVQLSDGQGLGPIQLPVHPSNEYLYVTNRAKGLVHKIDIETFEETAKIEVGKVAYGIAYTTEGDYAFVTNKYENTVSVIDTQLDEEIKTIDVGEKPKGIAIEDGKNQGW